MKFADLIKSRASLAGIGLVIFGVLAVVTLLRSTSAGEHPLALATDVDLCERLGQGIWVELSYPASDPVARAPADAGDETAVCALELDPVAPGDRVARIARGEDADEVRRIATVRLITTGDLRTADPASSTQAYVESFGRELEADGWQAQAIQGPWSWGAAYAMDENQVATLVEDHGVVLWSTATDVSRDNLARFTRSAANRIRSPN